MFGFTVCSEEGSDVNVKILRWWPLFFLRVYLKDLVSASTCSQQCVLLLRAQMAHCLFFLEKKQCYLQEHLVTKQK